MSHFYKALFTLILCLGLLPGQARAAVPLSPPANGYIADYAGVLSNATEQGILRKNRHLTAQTGAAIVVVTVNTLAGMDIYEYAMELFNTWGIGSAEENNGLLLLLAIEEENYYSLPGSGITDALTPSVLDNLQWNYLEQDFAAGDYDAGVRQLFDEYYNWFDDYYGGIGQPPSFVYHTADALTHFLAILRVRVLHPR